MCKLMYPQTKFLLYCTASRSRAVLCCCSRLLSVCARSEISSSYVSISFDSNAATCAVMCVCVCVCVCVTVLLEENVNMQMKTKQIKPPTHC